MNRLALGVLASVLALACNKEPKPGEAHPPSVAVRPPAPASAPTVASDAARRASIGKPAPDFTLTDLDGKEHRLSSLKGKIVVLEWFNPGCPFVKASHTKGSLKDAAKRHDKDGVVWLAINSGAKGRDGHGVEVNREGAKKFGMEHPILLDETGEVGRTYGATNTPHMFVVDAQGTLVYKGAIDNSPDGEGEAAAGGKLALYVDEAIAAAKKGVAPAEAETKPYGCSVKYAK